MQLFFAHCPGGWILKNFGGLSKNIKMKKFGIRYNDQQMRLEIKKLKKEGRDGRFFFLHFIYFFIQFDINKVPKIIKSNFIFR